MGKLAALGAASAVTQRPVARQPLAPRQQITRPHSPNAVVVPAAVAGTGPRVIVTPAGGGPAVTLEGVVAEMAMALARHAADIAATAKGAVELHWGPSGVQGRMVSLWETPHWPSPTHPASAPQPPSSRRSRPRRASAEIASEQYIILGDEAPPWRVG